MLRNWAAFILVATTFSAAANAQSPTQKLRVTATFSILADITAAVGGDRVDVKSLVAPAQDVHVYQPTPTDAAAVAESQVLIVNGLNFEGWMDRLVSAADFKGKVVTASSGIAPIENAELAHKHPQNGAHSHADPHVWQDVSNVLVFVANIKDGLCEADADGCAIFESNAAAYSSALRALDAELKSKFAAIPAERRKVITSHDAFGYFARAYAVTFLAPLGISTEEEASAQTVAQLITQIRNENISAVFVETVANTRLIEQIARETGIKPGPPLYADTLSGADGPASTYLRMMRYNAATLASAMTSP